MNPIKGESIAGKLGAMSDKEIITKDSHLYNWWTDPKNKDSVEKLSWWNHPENRKIVYLPISLVHDDGYWVASCSDETKKFLGELHSCAQGKSEEEAINNMFEMLRFSYEYEVECRLRYQRWVPLRVGPWGMSGGRWFSVFGINVSFRHGDNMLGGWYVQFTKLNISIHSDWSAYKNWKHNNR